jgi:eukaryotic-like serine/threonine-protein kinase
VIFVAIVAPFVARREHGTIQPSMTVRTRVWSVGKLFLLAGALTATYVIFAAVAMRVALRTREVDVPNLIGQTVNAATEQVAAVGLSLRVDQNPRPDARVPAGRIMQQDPPAGVEARRQRSVRVWLSAGARTTTVPPLVGEAERTARLRLDQDGLVLGAVSEFRSPDYPADSIVAQDPPASSRSGTVSVLVNRGEQTASYVMPDLIGVNGDRAADVLREQGFRVAVVGTMLYPGVAAGIVLRQSPQAGFQVAPGEPISIEVSR